MPIDPMMLNSMLGTFKNMVEECKAKDLSGEAYDQMCATYERMEQLGQEHSDFNAFNAQMTEENLMANFSNYYSQVLASGAASNGSGGSGGYDDQALLKQSVDALKSSVQEIKSSYERAIQESTDDAVEVEVLMNPDDVVAGIQQLIDLGEEEGMTYPRFLKTQIEKGLDQVADGGTTNRKSLEYELNFAKASAESAPHIERAEKKLEKYEELAAQNELGIPNKKKLKYALDDIEREYEPKIIEWNNRREMWEKLLSDLATWSLSYCSFAPSIQPWSMSADPQKAVIKTQKVEPGIFRAREQRYHYYTGEDFKGLLKHPSFQWEVEHYKFGYSQEFMTYLLQEVLPQCQPHQDLDREIVQKHEDMYNDNRIQNPEIPKYQENMAKFYDGVFGQGRYASRYGPLPQVDSNAESWEWSRFEGTV